MAKDVIVVGGGVIGCSIAWRLAQARLKVTLFERGRIGCEASRAAGGMLSPQGESQTPGAFFDLCLRSRAMYRSFAEELTEASGVDVEYKDEGTLFVVSAGENEAQEWTRWQIDAGLSIENISQNKLRKMEPAVTESATRGIFLPDEHQVENRLLMDALAIAINRAGVEIIEGAEVTTIATAAGRVTGIVSNGVLHEAAIVVIAAGAWSSRLLQPLGLDVEVTPARGQMIAVQGNVPRITRILHSNEVYLVPRRDGRILIGATVEYTGFHKAITAGAITRLLNAAVELVPSLKNTEIVECWSGLRPDTRDHFPVLGFSGIDNLLLATGHFRNGILLAPITAEMITALIVSDRSSDLWLPFAVERFGSRMSDVAM